MSEPGAALDGLDCENALQSPTTITVTAVMTLGTALDFTRHLGEQPTLIIRGTQEREGEISSLTKNVSDGAEVSLRRPVHSQERMRKKKSACFVRNDGGTSGEGDGARCIRPRSGPVVRLLRQDRMRGGELRGEKQILRCAQDDNGGVGDHGLGTLYRAPTLGRIAFAKTSSGALLGGF